MKRTLAALALSIAEPVFCAGPLVFAESPAPRPGSDRRRRKREQGNSDGGLHDARGGGERRDGSA